MASVMSHEQAMDILLTFGVLSPLVLRSIGDWTISLALDKYCHSQKKEFGAHLLGNVDSGVTIDKVWNLEGSISWNRARQQLGFVNNILAILVASIRLLFWHWLQPLLYFYVLFVYWDLLLRIQRILGLLVCGREAMYWIMTIIAVFVNPVYLLADLRSTWKEEGDLMVRMLSIGSYVIAPEKYVGLAIIKDGGGTFWCFVWMCLPLLDIAAVVACFSSFVVDNVYAPLITGYIITTLEGIFVITTILYGCCR